MRASVATSAVAAAVLTACSGVPMDAPLETYSDYCPIAGRYAVTGFRPGATTPYRGEAIVSAAGSGCYMRWFAPNESEGNGSYSNGVLTIYFSFPSGGNGSVRYTRMANGELQGTWSMAATPGDQGSETLTPISLAGR
jgi:hypothetical protein